jgi:hypothetical protein
MHLYVFWDYLIIFPQENTAPIQKKTLHLLQ